MSILLHLVWLLAISHLLDQRDQCRKYTSQRFNEVFNFTITLTLITTSQFLHKMLQRMIRYHQIKFDCKGISGSVGTLETVKSDYKNPHCERDHDLACSHPIFSQGHSGCKRLNSSEDIEETVIFWTYNCDPDLEDIQTNLFAGHSGSWWCIIIYQVWLQNFRCFRRYCLNIHWHF